ncbi:class I SAM-dependent DNA methyltransferase [Streptomyces durocortorensis]|uniref:site-specific DNA-methyltransferase (adenine-specific) n=1 Tax=Streptomyces durocortorensis TaxID=2811104 RepID=A0ABS2HWG1_9ACTN|nr:class I SAM-dependent DNA methyltransferase [Streptomyces durocortorensis]MBM7054960.1 type I restriction-modification system subunit M [Streptomyces durocortorensis]
MPPRKKKTEPADMKQILWQSADKLRGSLDAAAYKHFVLGLVFLKYVSAAMSEKRAQLEAELREEGGWSEADILSTLEERREYTGAGIFYVPQAARWEAVLERAGTTVEGQTVGEAIDAAMLAIEAQNPALKKTLPKIYASGRVDEERLVGLIRLLDRLAFQEQLGEDGHRKGARDIMGEVYEYFLAEFALKEGRKGGEYFTPESVVQLLVEVLEPQPGERVYDPACGSGGMFVQAEKFIESHGGNPLNVAVYGQELNQTTWQLAHMNLAIHGVEANLGDEPADTFRNDQHPALKADVVMANPPFNISDWGGEMLGMDRRWAYGAPPVGNANYAWLQHMISKLAPSGRAGVVLANGSMSSKQSGEGDIRRGMVEDDLVMCMIALPGQLFRSTQIPACLWFLAEGKGRHSAWVRGRKGEVLFIDAREFGVMKNRTLKELTPEEIVGRVGDTVRAWRGVAGAAAYEDVPGFCASVGLETVAEHDFVLTPGRYVGTAEAEADPDAEPVEAKIARLSALLREQFAESERLAKAVDEQLGRV